VIRKSPREGSTELNQIKDLFIKLEKVKPRTEEYKNLIKEIRKITDKILKGESVE
jgi:hypothetical protein